MDDRTKEIINKFEQSWIDTALVYDWLMKDHSWFENLRPLQEFIANLKASGESINFRLGTSLHFLIISRSVDHGLRPDQKYIRIEVVDKNDYDVCLRDGHTVYRQFRIAEFEDLRLAKLLRTLKDTLID